MSSHERSGGVVPSDDGDPANPRLDAPTDGQFVTDLDIERLCKVAPDDGLVVSLWSLAFDQLAPVTFANASYFAP